MAKLPNITEERRVVDAGVNAGVSPTQIEISPVAQATNKLGAQLEKSGTQIIETDNHVQRFNYALNKSRLTREHVNLLNKLEQDIDDTGDYATAQESYKKNLGELTNTLGEKISNSDYRAKFDEEANLLKENTVQKVYQIQKKAQEAQSYTLAEEELNNTVETVMKTRDPVQQQLLIKNGLAPVLAAIPNSDPDRALKIAAVEKEYRKRVGIGVFNSLEPRQQIAALDAHDKDPKAFSTVAFIPAEERPVYRKRAEQAMKQQTNDAVAKIRDQDFLKYHNAKENATNAIINGGNVADIPLDQYALLNESDRANLNKIQEIKNGTYQMDPIKGDEAYYSYSDMYQSNPEQFAKADPIKIRAEVSPDKVNQVLGWQQQAQKKINAPVNLQQYNNVATQTLKSIGVKPSSPEAVTFKNRLNQELEYYKESHGKDPSIKELQNMASDLVVKASFAGTLYGTNEKKVYQIPKGKVVEKIVVPEEFKNKVIQIKKNNGINTPTTEDQFKQLYLKDKFSIISDAGAADEITDTTDLLPQGTTDAKKRGFLPDQKESADSEELRGRPTSQAKIKKVSHEA